MCFTLFLYLENEFLSSAAENCFWFIKNLGVIRAVKKITIIGSGATGTLLAVNLIKHAASQQLEINLVERRERLGRGVAYSTVKDFHLLNGCLR